MKKLLYLMLIILPTSCGKKTIELEKTQPIYFQIDAVSPDGTINTSYIAIGK